MFVLRILLLGCFVLALPVVVGSLFAGMDKRINKLPFLWISGQMLLWAGFHAIALPLILTLGEFDTVVVLFCVYILVLTAAAAVRYVIKGKNKPIKLTVVDDFSAKQRRNYYIAWGIFWAVFLFQMVQAFRLAYADGDDAYYVATAAIAEESNTMYQKIAYTGGSTGLDIRYGLAPFPIWLAFLARISGIQLVSVAQMFVPPVLIGMAYSVYYLLACRLFAKHKKRIPLFMIFTELLILFGDYSMYTPEKFLIARSRQGKAALCAIVIPFLFFLLLMLMERLEEKQTMSLAYWGVLLCTLTTACLCSTLGAVLGCMLVGITGLCGAVCYRRWKLLLPMALCCVPCVIEALLYLLY